MRKRRNNKIRRKVVKTITWRAPVKENGHSDEKVVTEQGRHPSSDTRKNRQSISHFISTLIQKLTRRIGR